MYTVPLSPEFRDTLLSENLKEQRARCHHHDPLPCFIILYLILKVIMITKLVHPSVNDSHASPLVCRTMNIMKLQRFRPVSNRSWINTSRFGEKPLWFRPITIIKVAEQSSGYGLVEDEAPGQKKRELYQALEGSIFNYSYYLLL